VHCVSCCGWGAMAVAVEAAIRDCGESRIGTKVVETFLVALTCATVGNPCTVSLSTRKG
jgi:hypothetical protein